VKDKIQKGEMKLVELNSQLTVERIKRTHSAGFLNFSEI
jgi:hypothetical protein